MIPGEPWKSSLPPTLVPSSLEEGWSPLLCLPIVHLSGDVMLPSVQIFTGLLFIAVLDHLSCHTTGWRWATFRGSPGSCTWMENI